MIEENRGQTTISAQAAGCHSGVTEIVVCPRFSAGDRVRVRKVAPLGHIRTPFYIRGHTGTVERLCGNFPMPEELAQQRDGLPAQPLYRVRFAQREVWPDYPGRADDVVEIEIFQHWLEPA